MTTELTHAEIVKIVRILGYTIGILGNSGKHREFLKQVDEMINELGNKEFE